MMIIGVDPHKSTHTATAVDPHTNRAVASIRVHASLADYRRMLMWARQFDQRRWAVENAEGLGRHLSSWLLTRDETGGRRVDDRDRQNPAALARRRPQERPDRRRRC